ncbi:hypothetical protein ATANTOWER_016753 [Ataeniobius toweri]|uniref:Uncharacterized protein n=1 Tax=Ataeniobius toweri TaxID=208326 RepID=A0ABU7APW3_9TELE|nr:hypothetical protein [Ataeniobius toweri]
MSLLRVCSFAKSLGRRSLADVRMCFAERCQLCVLVRSGAVRRISGTLLCLQRRNVSSVIPKPEDAKKRVHEQSQLLDVLKVRIQQLQSDFVLDVQHAKVQFVKAPSVGGGISSGRTPKGCSKDKNDIPKSGQMVTKGASKSQPSRWMEKLSQEKKNKLKKQQHLQQKMQRLVKDKVPGKSKGGKSSLIPTGTTHKTISSAAKRSKGDTKLSDEIRAAVSSAAAVTAVASAKAAMTPETSKQKRKESKSKGADKEATKRTTTECKGKDEDLAEVEELEKRLNQQVRHWACSSTMDSFQESSMGNSCRDIQLSIRSYLEACVFGGDIERSHNFLLSQHRVMSRRKHLTTDVYNIMMRVWAKKVSTHCTL